MRKFSLAVAFLLLALAAFAEQAYPQLDISGFKKWEYKKADVDPNRNYFTGLTHLGGYYPTFTGGPWQERLQLKILGQLSENLSVTYDLEQQPETPDKFDVKVKYANNELTFGDFNAGFSGNEFVSVSKYLNGVMLTSKDTWYDIIAVPSAKLKSQTQSLTSQKGNNTRGPYNLGHGGIVEGSEQIQLNGNYLKRNDDYTIDYFEGKITFSRILSQTDEFKYTYEYTNLIDLFFPALSKKDFFGFQSRFTIDPEKFGRSAPTKEPMINVVREAFPSAGTLEPEVQERESAGFYQLKSAPVIKFSEALSFMGTQLKKNEDYLIRYDAGEIKLLTRFLPTSQEALMVEYKSYQTSLEAEVLAGIGSRGPYRTEQMGLVPESERVEVDGKLFIRDLDYTINYNSGEIIFGIVISPTSQIKIGYRYNVMAFPQSVSPKFAREIKIGTTYLKESAKKGVGSPTATNIESYTGNTIKTSNFTLNLNNRPVLSTSEASFSVWLKQGSISRELTWEADYIIPATYVDSSTGYARVTPECSLGYITDRSDLTDGYGTGTVFFINQNISASDEITITYTYKKSIVGKFLGQGNGSKGPYYIRNIRQIVPGTETVQVWDQGSSQITTYTRNTSFEANAGDTGYSINYSADNPSITFNKELPAAKNFQLIFQYVPPSTTGGGDISQVAYGFDGSFKIGDTFKVDSSFARSETDQVYVAESTSESFSGNGTKNYSLHALNDIVEGSEHIYVNQKLLNKDIDYYVSYTKPGQITFYYITPATQDAISVDYNFQSTSGIVVGGKVKTDTAFRLGAETKMFGDTLTLNGTTKKIGFDFSPLGGTAIGVGSEYEELNANFNPSLHSFYSNYSYKFNKNPIGTSHDTFQRSYDNSISLGINPGGAVKTDFSYRNYSTIDDPLSAGALHSNDNLQESYSGSLSPAELKKGILSLNQKYDFRRTISKSDVVDQGANRSTSNIDYYHAGGDLKLGDRLSLGCDYQLNEPTAFGSLETKTAHSRAVDASYNLSLDLTMAFLQKWAAWVKLMNHDEQRILPTPETSSSTKNETYHMDLTPFSLLSGSLDHNREERTSYIMGGENPRNSRTTGNARLSPFSWLSAGLNLSKSEAIPETGTAYKTTGRTTAYDVDCTPLSLSLLKLNSRFAASTAYQVAPLGSESVKTDTNTGSQNYTLNVNAIPILPLTLGYAQEDYKNFNNSKTSPVSTETQNLTSQAGLVFTAIPNFSLSADYNQKTTKDLLKGSAPVKTVLNTKASYQLISWGTLALDYQKEKNEGEVQGGVVAALNIEKETLTRSLNVTIPVDNPVLTSFVLVVSWKSVNYKNLAKPDKTDDFYAQLLTFEGTMNF